MKEEMTVVNEFGVGATIKIHWVGKYRYWLEINGCQETTTQSIPNPWVRVGKKKVDLKVFLSREEIEKLRDEEAEQSNIK